MSKSDATIGQACNYYSVNESDPTPAHITAVNKDGTVDLLTNGQDGTEREKTGVKLGEQEGERYAVLVDAGEPAAGKHDDPKPKKAKK